MAANRPNDYVAPSAHAGWDGLADMSTAADAARTPSLDEGGDLTAQGTQAAGDGAQGQFMNPRRSQWE
jgi:hypothetical protein